MGYGSVLNARKFPIFVFGLALCAGLASAEDGAENPDEAHLFGSWGGAHAWLDSHGVSVESILTHDLVANVSGGLQRDQAILGNYDLTATLDTEKAGLWSGGTLFSYVLANYGDEPGRFIGDAQGTDNISTYSTVKLYELWFQQTLADDVVSLLVGLHDYNSEFDSLDYAGEFIHASFGISPDISQVGPSIFSTTALAARARVRVFDVGYIQSALYDGVPGNPNNPRGTQIILKHQDGFFWGTEVGVVSPEDSDAGDHYKLAGGYWLHTTDFEDFAGIEHSSNSGFYGIGEMALWSETDADQGLGAFIQTGFARADRNMFRNYFGAGLRYVGLIPDRNEDVLALGVNRAQTGDAYRSATGSDAAELAIELTYRLALLPYLAIQPDFQYIINPGTDKNIDDAVVLSTRVEVAM